uniref:Uncharacterized protein n=1 Tax=Panagrolaimus sp. ES5 TaxID=591445 RepID=A0AC34EZG1_9BILA
MAVQRFTIRQKIFSLGDGYKIKNQFSQTVFYARSRRYTILGRIVLEDMTGRGLYKIREQWSLNNKYKIFLTQNNQKLVTIKRKLTSLRNEFIIESVYGRYVFKGGLGEKLYSLLKNGLTVATVNKKFFALSCEIEIINAEDQAFILAMIIVLNRSMFY